MKKKAMALLLSAAMAASALTGCGSGDGGSSSEASGSQGGQEESGTAGEESQAGGEEAEESGDDGQAAADDGEFYVDEDGNKYKKFDDVQLKMLICWNGGFKTADDQYNNDVAKAIRDKIGVTVEFEGINMSETEKLNQIFATGDMPDMINAPYWGGTAGETGVIKKGGNEGRLIDIKDMVPNYPNIADAYDIGVISTKYLENDIETESGARYVLPTEVAGSKEDIALWGYGVFVRGDVPEALGVDVSTIKTSEQLMDFMKQARDYGFKDINGNDCIVATTYHNGWSYGDYAQSFSEKKLTSYALDENGKMTHFNLTEDYVNKQLFIWEMVHEGILDKECFTQTDDRGKEKVGNGTALFSCAQYGITVDATKLTGLYDTHPEMRYIPVGPLNYKDGSPLVQIESEGRSGSPAIVFPTTCSNIDAALTWLDYLNSKEGTKLICYGFEGDTYELNEQGQPRMNADLTARYAENAEAVKEELRERGIMYMASRTCVAKKNNLWFGEPGPFEADALDPYVADYRKQRPAEVIPGYAIDALAPGFEGYDEFSQWAFDGEKEKEYKERAFFADTEEEARSILEDYQEYLRTQDGGKMQEFLDYMTEVSTSRDDIVY